MRFVWSSHGRLLNAIGQPSPVDCVLVKASFKAIDRIFFLFPADSRIAAHAVPGSAWFTSTSPPLCLGFFPIRVLNPCTALTGTSFMRAILPICGRKEVVSILQSIKTNQVVCFVALGREGQGGGTRSCATSDHSSHRAPVRPYAKLAVVS